MAKRGRPTDYSVELADTICERIADGESLRAICSEDDMPNKATVFRWLANDNKFSDQYAKARETQADSLFDEILTIADERENDVIVKEDGTELTQHDVIQRARLRVDARKWMAGKLRPKVYGEKLDIDQRTTHEAGDSIASLMERIANNGKRISDD